MSSVGNKIKSVELQISVLEFELEELEESGTYGGSEYDDIVEELSGLEHDLTQLRRLDEDDMC